MLTGSCRQKTVHTIRQISGLPMQDAMLTGHIISLSINPIGGPKLTEYFCNTKPQSNLAFQTSKHYRHLSVRHCQENHDPSRKLLTDKQPINTWHYWSLSLSFDNHIKITSLTQCLSESSMIETRFSLRFRSTMADFPSAESRETHF